MSWLVIETNKPRSLMVLKNTLKAEKGEWEFASKKNPQLTPQKPIDQTIELSKKKITVRVKGSFN